MKKILLPLLCFLFIQLKAKTTWTVTVQNFQFSPSNLNVMVGDIIHWKWIGGFHTTSSLAVPAGASSWDAPMNLNNPTFDYTVTTAGIYSYQCNVHPTQMVASFTVSSAVPVILSAFDVISVDGKPLLTWTTLTEINSDHFSIRKSFNGTDFKGIGTIPAAGNSLIEKDYSFTGEKIPSSIKYVYYTLAIVDKDGKTQLAPIKVYKNISASNSLIISISPNPISGMGHLMLQFNADKPGKMKVKIADMQGRIIMETELSAVAGINNGHIHFGDIIPGIYNVHFSLDGVNETFQIKKE